MTLAENALWEALRRDRFAGYRFRRQHPMGEFVADFYCHRLRLVIEIDGSVHEGQRGYDALRDRCMAQMGCSVLRFTNDEVLHALPTVMKAIEGAIRDGPSPGPSPSR